MICYKEGKKHNNNFEGHKVALCCLDQHKNNRKGLEYGTIQNERSFLASTSDNLTLALEKYATSYICKNFQITTK